LDAFFSTPQRPWRIASRLLSPMVRLPGGTSVRQVWHFPRGIVPVRPEPSHARNLSAHVDADDMEQPGDHVVAVWVVRESDVTAVGLILAAGVVISVGLSGARGRALMIVALAVAGLLVIWLPGPLRPAAWWPFVAALLTAAGAWTPIRGTTLSARQS